MSTLTQRIEQLGKSSPAPLGFGRGRRQEPTPTILVLASSGSTERLSALNNAGPDAFLFTPKTLDPQALAEAASVLGETPWGVRLQETKDDTVALLQEKGCDFIAFTATQVHLDALQNEELGRLLIASSDLDKEQALSLEDLPLDAVLSAKPLLSPLTLEALMVLAAQRGQIGKPFLLPIHSAPSPWELECLRGIGVDGLVLDLDQAPIEDLRTLHERVRALPRRKARGERPSPYIPQASFAGSQQQEHEEEEEEEEEEL